MNNISNERNLQWFYYLLAAISNERFQENQKYQKLETLPRMDDNDGKSFIFTHGGGVHDRSIDQMVIKAIDLAIQNNEFILLSSFIINNTEILDKLKEACYHLPGKVYILVGRTEPKSMSYDYSGNVSYGGLDRLAKYGGLIRKKEHAHLKFLISGSQLGIIMTTNITTEGLTRNPEFGLVTKDPSIIKALKRVFMILWVEKSEKILIDNKWEEAPNWSPIKRLLRKDSKSESKLILSSEVLKNEINETEQILHKHNLEKVINDLIRSSVNNIKISSYLIILNEKTFLFQLLLNKAKEGVKTQILVPLTKIHQSKDMQSTLQSLTSHQNISVRYYRELHGKVIIIDNEKALLLTANLDKYLFSDKSYDIGIEILGPVIISNIVTLYDHLWNEATSIREMYAPINLDLNLVIYSEESISTRHRTVSVLILENIVKNNVKMEWILHEAESKLRIYKSNGKRFDISMEHNSVEDSDEYITVTAKITPFSTFKDKNATFFSINELRVRLLWASDINSL